MLRNALPGALALALFARTALAQDAPAPPRCIDASVPRAAIAARDGKWIALTPEQWQFLRGVYTMDPETPAGLPYGDRAVLATMPDHHGGLVFFIDGNRACTPLPVPKELLDMLNDVATGAIAHEGAL